jgi:ubiquitin-protein ligase
LVTFSIGYPREPPGFRYISVPFHVNISDAGRICLNLLEKEYTQACVVFELLISVRTLLECPNYDDPIDLDRKQLSVENPEAFKTRAERSCRNAKRSIEKWLEVLETG